MVFVEVVYVLSADDVDFGVPVVVKRIQGSEAFLLLGGEVGEVMVDKGHRVMGLKGLMGFMGS